MSTPRSTRFGLLQRIVAGLCLLGFGLAAFAIAT